VMQNHSVEAEVGRFLNKLMADVQKKSETFEASFLNVGCKFHIGNNVPHKNLIKTAFLPSYSTAREVNVYLSTSTDSIGITDFSSLEVINDLHPVENRFGNYRFSADPSGNFLYFYNMAEKIGGIWISPSVMLAPEMLITPFRTLISWLLEEDGGVILHASSFTLGGRKILLVGPSGSGKSTIAFEALARSEIVICDDAIALTSTGCFPIYTKMKMKSYVDLIEVSGSHIKCEQVGSKSVLDLKKVLNYAQIGYLPDLLLFPSLASKSEFVHISTSEALKKIMIDSFSETLGAPIGALRLINSVLSQIQAINWKLDPEPSLNWDELKAKVSQA
jgi:hypothetical protein